MKIYKMLFSTNDVENYVCAIKCPKDYTMEEGVTEMIKHLQQKDIFIDVNTRTECSVYGKNSCYTLAHSFHYENNKKIFKPEGFYRHCYSTIFSIDAIYFDENKNECSYPKNGLRDYENNVLSFTNLKKNPFIDDISLLKRINYHIDKGWDISPDISSMVSNLKHSNELFNPSVVKEINSDPCIYFKVFQKYNIHQIFMREPFIINLSLDLNAVKKIKKIVKDKKLVKGEAMEAVKLRW